MEGAEGSLCLKLTFPNEMARAEEHDVSCMTAGTCRLVLRFSAMQTSKVGIHIIINLEDSGRGKDDALI